MALLDGIHHVATLTADLDRLIGFYERVLDASVTMHLEEDGVRHAFIDVGGGVVLHPFQIRGVEVPQGDMPPFARGRVDHFALRAPTEDAFEEVRRRVAAEGAGDGSATDMGVLLTCSFTDPDGLWLEVVWLRPGAPPDRGLRREEWTTVALEPS